MTAVEASSFPSFQRRGGRAAAGVVRKRSRSLVMDIRVAHLIFSWNLLTTPSGPLRNGNYLFRAQPPLLLKELKNRINEISYFHIRDF